MRNIEEIWEGIFSRQPQQIKVSFLSLSKADQQDVVQHLKKMVSEPGWHAEQIISAKTALDVISKLKTPE